MRTFKEFPCTVYELTPTYKVRKVVVTSAWNTWGTGSGRTSRGGRVSASDCHPSFKAATTAGLNRINTKLKRLVIAQQKLADLEVSMLQAQAKFENPPAKPAKKEKV